MGVPGATPYAAAPPTATTTVQPAAATTTTEGKPGVKVSLLPSRSDPFVPFDYKPLKYRPKPRIMLPPIGPLVTRWEEQGVSRSLARKNPCSLRSLCGEWRA